MKDEPFEVLEEGWDVFLLFVMAGGSGGCWCYPPGGGPALGLHWPSVECLGRARRVPWDADTVEALAAAERAAVEVWAAKHRRDHPELYRKR